MSFLSPAALARWSARHPWIIVLAWLLLAGGAAVSAADLDEVLTAGEMDFLNSPESVRGGQLLEEAFGESSEGAQETVIVHSSAAEVDEPAFRRAVESLDADFRALEGVTTEPSYYEIKATAPGMAERLVSAGGDALLVPVSVTGQIDGYLDALERFRTTEADGGFEAYTVGPRSTEEELKHTAEEDLRTAEFYGLPVTLLVLLAVFGAVVAAGLSLLLAFVSILVAVGAAALVGNLFGLSFFVVNMIWMIGLAVGIDYTLFIVERYREERVRGLPSHRAIGVTGATASKAVLFSGGTVILALSGLFLVPIAIFRSLGTGAVLVVAAAVVAVLTLVPALLALLGDRVNWPRRLKPVGSSRGGPVAHSSDTVYEGFWGRVTRVVMVRPVLTVVVTAGVLLLAAVPYLDLERGAAGPEGLPEGRAKTAYQMLVEEFPERAGESLEIVVGSERSPEVQAALSDLVDRLRTDPLFVQVLGTTWDPQGTVAVVTALPAAGGSSDPFAAVELLREELVPASFAGTRAEGQVLVTGATAFEADSLQVVSAYTPWVFAFVLGLSFVLLLLLFRSVVVPLKAIVMNLLSVGAAYGLLVLVFQKGYGNDLLGFQRTPVIESWVPIFLFCILFGLSMDYHVFLLSRIREHFDGTGHNAESVAVGLRSTGRIITGAAAIMVVVFSTFAAGDLIMMQQVGFGLAVAIFLDATIVRSALVPAGMILLGRLNWYLPSWLRRLPDLRIEGGPPGKTGR